MRKILVLLPTIMVMFAAAQTNIYHPFPDSNACWNITYYQYYCTFGDAFEDYSITISGDTIINSESYLKLSTPCVNFYNSGTCTQTHYPGYKGAIRQDIPNKKVYFIPPISSTEYLLYDFNMNVGDTIQGYIASYSGTYDTVILIDSVLVGNDFRKRWYINDWYDIYFIEGIGSTYGLLENSPGYSTDAPGFTIDCFLQDGETLYPDTNLYCQLITTIRNIEDLSDFVQVFPNPSKGSFFIKFEQMNDFRNLQITDLVGNIVFQKEITDQKQLNTENLPAGVYLLTLTDKDNRTANKVLISCP
jgi:hypothetical protein